MSELVDCVINNPALVSSLEALGFKSKNPGGMTFREAMLCSQIASAVRGDRNAYNVVKGELQKGGVMPLQSFVDNYAAEVEKVAEKGENEARGKRKQSKKSETDTKGRPKSRSGGEVKNRKNGG